MILLSGRAVYPNNLGVPSVGDLALGLSRLPRFAAQTTGDWFVADHLLLGVRLVPEELELAWLLHDTEEAVTSDIPTTWKSPEQKRLVGRLRQRICRAYGARPLDDEQRAHIATLDLALVRAEAEAYAPQVVRTSGLDQAPIPPALLRAARAELMSYREHAWEWERADLKARLLHIEQKGEDLPHAKRWRFLEFRSALQERLSSGALKRVNGEQEH